MQQVLKTAVGLAVKSELEIPIRLKAMEGFSAYVSFFFSPELRISDQAAYFGVPVCFVTALPKSKETQRQKNKKSIVIRRTGEVAANVLRKHIFRSSFVHVRDLLFLKYFTVLKMVWINQLKMIIH